MKAKKVLIVASIGLIMAAGLASAQDTDDLVMNHDTQVAVKCAQQFGVSWPAAGCIASLLTIEEIDKCFDEGFGGEDGCFGKNNTMVALVRDNIVAAQRENGDANKVIRAMTGISVKDLQDHGLLGGQNSEARKECRRLPKWGFKC